MPNTEAKKASNRRYWERNKLKTVQLQPLIHQELKALASKNKSSMGEMIRELISLFVSIKLHMKNKE